MIMRIFWSTIAGLLLGGALHFVTILTLPYFTERDLYHRISELNAQAKMTALPATTNNAANDMDLDPALLYGVCQLNLRDGPGLINGILPTGFWSVSVFDPQGLIVYSTTNRSASNSILDMGIFNTTQVRMLADQSLELQEGLIIVQSPTDMVTVVLRLAVPHEPMRDSYKAALENLRCINL